MPEKDVEAQFQEAVASTLRAMAGGTEHDVVFVGDNTFLHHDKVRLPKLNDITKVLNAASSGSIKKLLNRQELTGGLKNQLYLPELTGFKANKVYFIGLGKKNKELNEDEFSNLSNALSKITISANSKNLDIFLPEIKVKSKNASWVYKILTRDIESGCYQYFFDGKK